MYNNSFSRAPRRPAGRFGQSSNRRSSSSRPARGGSRHGAFIHPSKFVNKAIQPETQVAYVPMHAFADFALDPGLKKNIAARGYVTPTPIQDGSIPSIIEGKDLIGLANTGTGKTAAFILPIINRLFSDKASGGALIMAPTRELAQQIDEEFRAFSRGSGLLSALCVGGMSIGPQISALRRRPEVVIGTPGRLRDLNEQGKLRLDSSSVLVLDEADRMLDMGFSKDIYFLIDQLPKVRQSLCFSATITPAIEVLMQQLLIDPVTVSVRTGETADHIEQDVVEVSSGSNKFETLHSLLSQPQFEKVLIFGETKHGVQRLADNLSQQGHAADAIHGNKSQPQRQRTLNAFKQNKFQILVATDVAARGLDIPNVSHVINYDQPNSYEDYVHRIGRTGRGGKSGIALTFIAASSR